MGCCLSKDGEAMSPRDEVKRDELAVLEAKLRDLQTRPEPRNQPASAVARAMSASAYTRMVQALEGLIRTKKVEIFDAEEKLR